MVLLSASLREMVMCIHINTMGLNIASYSFGCLPAPRQLTHKCRYAPPEALSNPRAPTFTGPAAAQQLNKQLKLSLSSSSGQSPTTSTHIPTLTIIKVNRKFVQLPFLFIICYGLKDDGKGKQLSSSFFFFKCRKKNNA